MKTVYIAHPLGGGPDRALNLERAARWVAWAARQGVAPSATWIVLARQWAETPANRKLGLACDVAAACACDEFWHCGPRISPGMIIEATGVYRYTKTFIVPESHGRILDLSYAGLIEPPELGAASAALLAGAKAWQP